MLAYERRARWIRRMQDRAARRREREWARQAGFAAAWSCGRRRSRGHGSPRAA